MSRNYIKKLKSGGRVLLVLDLACLIYFMFFSESYGRTEAHAEYRYNLVLFQEIRRFLTYRDILGMPAVLLNVVGNVVVFIPYGCGLPLLFERLQSFWRIAVLSFAASLLAETMQLILRVGCFDVDDLLLNTLGVLCGYGLWRLLYHFVPSALRRFHCRRTGE